MIDPKLSEGEPELPAPTEDTKHPRIPGSTAGEIWMAPDFDELPGDMAEAFGIR